MFESQEFLFTSEIQKWQATTSHLQWGSISLEVHWEGVRGIQEHVVRVVTDYMTHIDKANQQ